MDAFLSVLIPVFITGLVNIILFRFQMKKEEQQDKATANKIQSEAWEMLVGDLRLELERQKTTRADKEKEFLDHVDNLKNKLDMNAQYFRDLLENQRKLHLGIVNELREELDQVHKENKELTLQNVALTKLVNKQTEKIQLLQEAKDALVKDVKRLQRDTGELKKNGKNRI